MTQPRKVPSVVVHVSPDPSGELPFLPSASRASAQRRKRSVPCGQDGGAWVGNGNNPKSGLLQMAVSTPSQDSSFRRP